MAHQYPSRLDIQSETSSSKENLRDASAIPISESFASSAKLNLEISAKTSVVRCGDSLFLVRSGWRFGERM